MISARPPESVLRLAGPLEPAGPLAALNGAILMRTDRSIVARQSIPDAIAQDLVQRYGDRDDVSLNVYSAFEWLVRKLDHRVAAEAEAVGFGPAPLPDGILRCAADKILLSVEPDDQDRFRSELDVYRDGIAISVSQPGYIEITHLEANKAQALRNACAEAGLDPGNVMAAGDGENDVPMLRVCGWPVTMRHGVEAAKREAKAVVGSNDDDSLAVYVARIFDIGLS